MWGGCCYPPIKSFQPCARTSLGIGGVYFVHSALVLNNMCSIVETFQVKIGDGNFNHHMHPMHLQHSYTMQ